ncbi:MAG: polyprenyl synthetase family protein [Succinivibrio sp.]|nr:polyprenyl synthetase family protein [Succinivibrio sp.]
MNLQEYSAYVCSRINAFMEHYIDELDDEVPSLKEAIRYGLLLGGKRARPLLVYATGTMLSVREEQLDYVAAACECIHAYSLIHDDMPEMDNDKLRRGRETVHVKFGPALALLAGDTLQALAFELLSDPRSGLRPESVVRLSAALARFAGYRGMCGGQALDLLAENVKIPLESLRLLHAKKTGALIQAAVLMGAMASGREDEKLLKTLEEYAKQVGLAFQIWDDVLDVVGDTAVMGKTALSDVSLNKSTYPALLGLETSKRLAAEASDQAINALSSLSFDTELLRQFAVFCVTRDH